MSRAAMVAALVVETRKVLAAPTVLATTVLLVLGIGVLTTSLLLAAEAGNERVLAQFGDLAAEDGWARLTGAAAQITAAGALLAFGVVLSWMFGREFAEGTISALFALPVSRSTIALAKLVTYLAWAVAVGLFLVLALTALGLALRLGPMSGGVLESLLRQFTLTVLSALLAFPAAWVSTVGRGLLPGIAITIVLIMAAQVMAVAGVGAWFPVAAPALWALVPESVSVPQLALVAVVPIVSGLLTMWSWSRLQLDR